ncbi:MAG: hypothetical protein HHJ17_05185 [Rhodoferax sp.]|uniref:hypothetical protein n=1 Tax=Rhodoferax sp. TaxID=50421 RepID=UPI0017FF937D|nr:hypothetical protein [Rhodoferax sp.]NMM12927.1 hypothetical protein [Rhodoferax sp.]
MARFTREELQKRAFFRTAWVLQNFWEEQQDENPRGTKADVHSRLFDTLVHEPLILIGKSTKGGGHKEHLVPCALIRNRAFEMFHDGKQVEDVAEMIGTFLRIAHISPDEARLLDIELKLKTTMPVDWSFETGSVLSRLEKAGIKLVE